MLDIVALGELLIDFTYVSADAAGYPTMAAHPGGAPANFLASAAKYGAKTALIGKVGDDAFGKLLSESLRSAGIRTDGLVTAENVFTTLAFVTLDADGNRAFSFARKPGADTRLAFEEVDLSLLDEARAFHFGTLSLTNEPARSATCRAVEYTKQRGKLISFDPNLRKPLWPSRAEAEKWMLWGLAQADVVKISDEEGEFLWGLSPEAGAEKLLRDFGVKLALVTCGPNGCVYRNRNAAGCVPALGGLQVVDTTGAGDIFGGAALWKLLQSYVQPEDLSAETLDAIVRFACAVAGLSTEQPGGISSVPEPEAVFSRTGLR